MELPEAFQHLEDLRKILSECERAIFYTSREVDMWRDRYLCSLEKENNTKKAAYLWCVFKYTPSSEMIKTFPEKIIEDAKTAYESNKN